MISPNKPHIYTVYVVGIGTQMNNEKYIVASSALEAKTIYYQAIEDEVNSLRAEHYIGKKESDGILEKAIKEGKKIPGVV